MWEETERAPQLPGFDDCGTRTKVQALCAHMQNSKGCRVTLSTALTNRPHACLCMAMLKRLAYSWLLWQARIQVGKQLGTAAASRHAGSACGGMPVHDS